MNDTDIFLTHMHSDHCGLCARMASPNTKIYISETDKKILSESSTDGHWNNLYERSLTLGFTRAELEENRKGNPIKVFAPPGEMQYTAVDDGFIIDLGNYKLKTVATPGHTPGHMCLYEEEHKIFFSGDHIIFDITPNITSIDASNNPLGLYLESLKKTKNLDIITTLSAHRSPTGDCAKRVDELLEHHRKRIEEALSIVRENPESTACEIASKMKWSIRAKSWADFPNAQKWFAVGEAEAHLEYLLSQGLIDRKLTDRKYIYNVK